MVVDYLMQEFVLTIFLSGISLILFWILIKNFKSFICLISAMLLVGVIISTSYYSIQYFKGYPSSVTHLPDEFRYYWHRVIRLDTKTKKVKVLIWIKKKDDVESRLIRVVVDTKTARQLRKAREMVRKNNGSVNIKAKKGKVVDHDKEKYRIKFVPKFKN